MSLCSLFFVPLPLTRGLRQLGRRLLPGAALLACLAGSAAAGPVPWPDGPYSYYANGAQLETVLAEFASSFSLGLSVQPGVSGTVNGRFTARNPTEFIMRLGGVYGFTWYTHAGTLYVSKASDIATRSLPAPGGSLSNLRQALTDLGVLEPRFGWGELSEQGVVMVSGPPSYVSLVEATLNQLPPAARAQQVAVFRLKNASAEDRVILYRDRQITQPGLATVLRELVASRGGPSAVGGDTAGAPAKAATAPANANAEAGTALPAAASGPSTTAAGGSTSTRSNPLGGRSGGGGRSLEPSIQSDPRLNALIIQDIPERMPMYARLIEQLDVPSALIEIEAMIIDINTDRARELGINWAARAGGLAFGFGAITQQPSAGTLALVAGAKSNNVNTGTLVVDQGNYLINQIRILETRGEARIQSRPSVLTTDNIGALLDLSETFYVRLQGERVASLTPVTAGTTLRVTPRVVDNGGGERVVQLTVDIEDGQIQDRQVDTLPTVRRSAVSTQAVVRQEETLLIAGHSSDQNIENSQRVPVLGDLPGVGLLFSNRTRTIEKRERLFMIKPKIVSLQGAAVPAVAAAPAAAVLQPAVAPQPAPAAVLPGVPALVAPPAPVSLPAPAPVFIPVPAPAPSALAPVPVSVISPARAPAPQAATRVQAVQDPAAVARVAPPAASPLEVAAPAARTEVSVPRVAPAASRTPSMPLQAAPALPAAVQTPAPIPQAVESQALAPVGVATPAPVAPSGLALATALQWSPPSEAPAVKVSEATPSTAAAVEEAPWSPDAQLSLKWREAEVASSSLPPLALVRPFEQKKEEPEDATAPAPMALVASVALGFEDPLLWLAPAEAPQPDAMPLKLTLALRQVR